MQGEKRALQISYEIHNPKRFVFGCRCEDDGIQAGVQLGQFGTWDEPKEAKRLRHTQEIVHIDSLYSTSPFLHTDTFNESEVARSSIAVEYISSAVPANTNLTFGRVEVTSAAARMKRPGDLVAVIRAIMPATAQTHTIRRNANYA